MSLRVFNRKSKISGLCDRKRLWHYGSGGIWGIGLEHRRLELLVKLDTHGQAVTGSKTGLAYKLKCLTLSQRASPVFANREVLLWKCTGRVIFAVERAAVKRVVSLSENTGLQTRLRSWHNSWAKSGKKAVKRRWYMPFDPRLPGEMDVRHGL